MVNETTWSGTGGNITTETATITELVAWVPTATTKASDGAVGQYNSASASVSAAAVAES